MLKIDPNISIFIQLADFIRQEIFSGKRKPQDRIESIREMAMILEVNPNTIKRVYQELEDEGLIETNGNLGFFVTANTDRIAMRKQDYIKKKLDEFLLAVKNCGLSNDDIAKHIMEEYYGTDHSNSFVQNHR